MQRKKGKKPTDHGASKKKAAGLSTEKQHGGEEEMKTTYSIESEALECAICFMPFEPPVYMCKNGHAACGTCCAGMKGQCPYCGEPIGDIRCRPLERVLAAMSAPCKFRGGGCAERRSHDEKSCPMAMHATCLCPFDGCAYYGRLLYNHIRDKHMHTTADAAVSSGCLTVTLHKSTPFHVLLHGGAAARVLLLLNCRDVVPSGRSLSLVSVGPPPPPANSGLLYKIVVVSADETAGELALTDTVSHVRRRIEKFKPEKFLFVPNAYWGSSGTVSVTVHV
ncbi:hypothetical protein E2562_026890 [Oryza meyeriana var. granulata]|uniref:RING-type E3 ubiquitin transferase n=1 Tax=Oryza meyeriana var. granulata TaxID=110450 RepID=A0A6G1EPL6_9ORYZ|nr:hypothetical protein E2562_026890 [Oryza meyeriana var. granulata]